MLKYFISSLISFLLIFSASAQEIKKEFDGAIITLTFTSGATKDKVIGVKKQDTIHVLVPHHAQRIYDNPDHRKYEFTVTYYRNSIQEQ
jgi:hypothetical protein